MWLNRFTAAGIFCFAVFLSAVSSARAQQPFKYDPAGLRNPFIPQVTSDGRLVRIATGSGSGDLIVQGIIFDEKGASYAIINSAVVKPGDSVDGWNVFKIEKNKVIISRGSQYRELDLEKTQ